MIVKRRIVDIIEARMASTRLPGKVLKSCQGLSMLGHMVERLKLSKMLDGIVIATTKNSEDDPIEELANNLGVGCFRGSENDVLERVVKAAHVFNAEVIVETPGDCPAIDWKILDQVVIAYLERGDDYVSNNLELTYPGGMDVQVFSRDILDDVMRRTYDPVDREHVSLFIYRNQDLYKVSNVRAPAHLNVPEIKLLLDTQHDYDLLCRVFDALYPVNNYFDCQDIVDLFNRSPELFDINKHVKRTKV